MLRLSWRYSGSQGSLHCGVQVVAALPVLVAPLHDPAMLYQKSDTTIMVMKSAEDLSACVGDGLAGVAQRGI